MDESRPISTPMCTTTSLTKQSANPFELATEYRMLVGSLQYLSLTRPDVSFAVNKLSQFMHSATTTHWSALKRLLRYIKGSVETGIIINKHGSPLSLHGYSNADWAGDKDDYISTTGCELLWVTSLLNELGILLKTQPVLYCDNMGAKSLSANPVFHSRMKHIALAFHFVREQVQSGSLRVSFVSTEDQLADVLTKPLLRKRFHTLIDKLGLFSPVSCLRGHVKE
ncbi:hypothetical protein MRB53_025880 [Persea americana]|uniref:Uncharacterized protein n=1 Tax=Persea americana TaxID=3435 RepID=A0ACC2LGK6_PERAE|nr:hypothetical protein MRB53_025880 [Persea americana]